MQQSVTFTWEPKIYPGKNNILNDKVSVWKFKFDSRKLLAL